MLNSFEFSQICWPVFKYISVRTFCPNFLSQSKVVVIWSSVFFPVFINKFCLWLLALLFFLKTMLIEGSVFVHATSDPDTFETLDLSNWNTYSLYHSLGFLECVKFCILRQSYSSMFSFCGGLDCNSNSVSPIKKKKGRLNMKKAYRVLFLEGPYLGSNRPQDDCQVTGVSALAEKYSKSLGDTLLVCSLLLWSWSAGCNFEGWNTKWHTGAQQCALMLWRIFQMFWNTSKLSWKPRYLFQSEPPIKIAY